MTSVDTVSTSVAEHLDPAAMLGAIRAAGVTHVVTVPDTHQKSLLELLAAAEDIRLVTVCTEDEAIAIGAGLWVGGCRPLLLIQNAGLYASMNSVRGISLDAGVPTCLLVGEYLRDPALPSRHNAARVVRLTEPTLELWDVPFYRLETEADLEVIPIAYERAMHERRPVALLVGATTAPVASGGDR